ncbi:MAG: shikimate dehydrogenase [Erysipelotrichaceae bacterium]|nr:shikimate dehydrogenase [Erysipelotrichaceae bacterium]
MKLGLIGNPLGHSWSPQIHNFLINEDYELWPLEESQLDDFFKKREFDGINVTIPYKKTVISYLDEIDDVAERMQAVNCIVNENDRLKGYNTDYIGLKDMLLKHEVSPENGTVAILGTGGASKAAVEVCNQLNWKYQLVSRNKAEGCISYDELYQSEEQFTVIINATPVGMFPNVEETPVNISRFTRLSHVVDIVANPVTTRLMFEAKINGINTLGGLEMLVSQAKAADELFTGNEYPDFLVDECVEHLLRERRNIVLIGMPSSGKSTVGKKLAKEMNRKYIDMDREIVNRIGMSIADYFARYGEQAFRDVESQVCQDLRNKMGLVIATGGGVIKREENMLNLSYNGYIVWLDRYVGNLVATKSRPLSQNRDDIYKLYYERKDLYLKYSDARIKNNGRFYYAAERIRRLLGE